MTQTGAVHDTKDSFTQHVRHREILFNWLASCDALSVTGTSTFTHLHKVGRGSHVAYLIWVARGAEAFFDGTNE
jgi:hypothetical protein